MGIGISRRDDYKRHSARARKSPRWAAVRFEAKRRDGFRCVSCGTSMRLEVDHKIPVRDAPELAYELSNLQTLCLPCHSRKTKTEVGFGLPTIPGKDAWKKLVKELANPNQSKERLCLNL